MTKKKERNKKRRVNYGAKLSSFFSMPFHYLIIMSCVSSMSICDTHMGWCVLYTENVCWEWMKEEDNWESEQNWEENSCISWDIEMEVT